MITITIIANIGKIHEIIGKTPAITGKTTKMIAVTIVGGGSDEKSLIRRTRDFAAARLCGSLLRTAA